MNVDAATVEQAAEPYVHPDDLELQKLEQEAAALETEGNQEGAQNAPQNPPETPTKPQPEPEPEAQPAPQPEQIHIPKQRFDEVLAELRAAKERELEKDRHLAFLAGQVEARKAATAAPQAETAQPQADPIAENDARVDELAERYDAGEIGMAEFKREERRLQKEREALIAERSQPSPEQLAQQIQADPYLGEKTAQLEAQNPWINQVPQKVVQHSLLPLAYEILAEKGIRVGTDVRSTLVLRHAVVEAGKILGLDQRHGSPSLPVDPRQQATQQPSVDQRRQKVEMARNHPPAMANAGTGAAAGQTYTPEDINKMSDVDLAALPASLLEQIAPSR